MKRLAAPLALAVLAGCAATRGPRTPGSGPKVSRDLPNPAAELKTAPAGVVFGNHIHILPPIASATESYCQPARLSYFGGPVVSSARVVAVLWGPGVDATVRGQIGGFYATVLNGPYMDWLSEYSPAAGRRIGRGSFYGAVTIAPANAAASLSDVDFQKELLGQISSGALPPPDGSTLYMVYLPPGVSVIGPGNDLPCVSHGYCGYHGAFSLHGTDAYYAVLPDYLAAGSACGGSCGCGAPFEKLTRVSSHELTEIVTDGGDPLGQRGWNTNIGFGCSEIGDMCSHNEYHLDGYAVQKEWSNARNTCYAPRETAPGQLRGLVHLENLGDVQLEQMAWAGTSGQGLRLEGFQVDFSPAVAGLGLEYTCHIENQGDTPWLPGGSFCGTRGQGLRLEELSIRLTGASKDRYDVYYQCHVENIGDVGPVMNGAPCGTKGQSLRVEAMNVWVAPKNPSPVSLSGTAYLQGLGAAPAADHQFFGTRGQSRAIEGLTLDVAPPVPGLGLQYTCDQQGVGSSPWLSGGSLCGTTGAGAPVDGVALRLAGAQAAGYDVGYACHVQDLGDVGPAQNGDHCGFCFPTDNQLEGAYVWVAPKFPGAGPAPGCNATTCPNGCCAGGVCRPGGSVAYGCVGNGAACQPSCPAGDVCGSGACVCSTRTTCAAQGKDCGSISDGCGGTLSCGACRSGQTCANNVCVGVNGFDCSACHCGCNAQGTACFKRACPPHYVWDDDTCLCTQ